MIVFFIIGFITIVYILAKLNSSGSKEIETKNKAINEWTQDELREINAYTAFVSNINSKAKYVFNTKESVINNGIKNIRRPIQEIEYENRIFSEIEKMDSIIVGEPIYIEGTREIDVFKHIWLNTKFPDRTPTTQEQEIINEVLK